MRTFIYFACSAVMFGSLLANLRGTPAGPGPGTTVGQLSSIGTRILEGRKQRGTAARSTVAVSAYGPVFEREPAGRRCRVFLRAAAGIRTSPDGTLRGLYLSAIGLLRAQARIFSLVAASGGYVKERSPYWTSQAALWREDFRVNWIAGHRPCRTSWRFSSEERSRGRARLVCRNADKAPDAGWCGKSTITWKVGTRRGRTGQSPRLSAAERLQGVRRPITLITPFFGEVASGHAFAPRRISEICRARICALGLRVSRKLFCGVGRSARTNRHRCRYTPGRCQSAYGQLRAYAPNLPGTDDGLRHTLPLGSRWRAHVFRALNPRLHFYARSNYGEEIGRELGAPAVFDKQFFGRRLQPRNVRSFKPDITIDPAPS